MGTILGDAKIRLSLDVEAVKRQLEELTQRGVEVKERPDYDKVIKEKHEDRDRGIQSTKNAPMGHAFKLARAMAYGNPNLINAPPLMAGVRPAVVAAQLRAGRVATANLRQAHGLGPANQSAAGAFMANFSAGKAAIMGLQAYIVAKSVKAVISAAENSPKATAFLKGLAPGAATNGVDAFASHVSDQVTDVRAKFGSFGRAMADEKAVGAAALRLGQHVTGGGAMDLFHWLRNQNEREERMRLRVDKELDREVMRRLGDSIRLSAHR